MPNVITSPEQQSSIRNFLNLRRETDPQPGVADIHPAVFALMHGLTAMKANSDAKQAADDIANAPTPEIHVKTRVDPGTGQTVHDVSHKNLQFGDAQQTVQDAYSYPHQQLDEVMREVARRKLLDDPGPGGGQLPADLQQGTLDTIGGKFRAERKSGEGIVPALVKALLIQALPDKLERHTESELGKGVEQKRQRAALRATKDELPVASQINTERRLAGVDRRDQNRLTNNAIDNTNWLSVGLDPDKLTEAIAGQAGIDPSQITPSHLARAKRVFQDQKDAAEQQAQKAHDNKVESFRKDPALGQFPTVDAAITALGEPLDKPERAQFEQDFNRAREITLRQRQNEDFRVRADQRSAAASERGAAASERMAAKSEAGKTVDAGAVFRGTLTPDALIAYKGNKRYDQDSVDSAIKAGADHFQGAVDTRQTQMAAIDQILAGKPDNPTEAERERFANLNAKKQQLLRQNRNDIKALTKLRSGAPDVAAAPAASAQPVAVTKKGALLKAADGSFVYQRH